MGEDVGKSKGVLSGDGRKEKEKGWFVSDMENVVFLGRIGRVA